MRYCECKCLVDIITMQIWIKLWHKIVLKTHFTENQCLKISPIHQLTQIFHSSFLMQFIAFLKSIEMNWSMTNNNQKHKNKCEQQSKNITHEHYQSKMDEKWLTFSLMLKILNIFHMKDKTSWKMILDTKMYF